MLRVLCAAVLWLGLAAAAPAWAWHWDWGWGHHHRHGPSERGRRSGRADAVIAEVRSTWTKAPADSQWEGERYVSPDGSAWIAFYKFPADKESASAHIKAVAFADGEDIGLLEASPQAVAVAGRKAGDRAYYRRAVIDCESNTWQHVAMEYPAEQKDEIEPIALAASKQLDRTLAQCSEARAPRR